MHVLLCLTGGKVTWDPQSGQAMVTLGCSYRRPHFLYGQSCQGEWGGAHRVTKWGQTMLQTSKNLVDSFYQDDMLLSYSKHHKEVESLAAYICHLPLWGESWPKRITKPSLQCGSKRYYILAKPQHCKAQSYTSDAHGLWMSSQSLKFPFHLY